MFNAANHFSGQQNRPRTIEGRKNGRLVFGLVSHDTSCSLIPTNQMCVDLMIFIEGRSLAAKYSCKFIEISCTIGFNLDNLLAGIRTQLILRHHMALNSIFKLQGELKTTINMCTSSPIQIINTRHKMSDAKEQQRTNAPDKADKSGPSDGKQAEVNRGFVRRIFRRYLADNDHYNDYDCDNFYKL